jgi:hypothetical protein
MGARELPEGALRDPRTGEIYHETLDDAGKMKRHHGAPLNEHMQEQYFRLSCVCSWIIVILSLTTSVGCLVAVGDMSYIRNSICAEPEVPSDWDGTLDALMACDEEFTNFGSCLLFCRNMIGSACMTACFLREANWESATLAYTLAIKYENLTRFVPDLTPELAHKQIYDEVADQNSNPSRVARALGVAPRLLQAADDDVEATLALQEDTVREVAYDGLAIASAIALLAVGAFTPLYACVCVASTCNAVPAFLALRALTGSLAPADVCRPPLEPAKMHKHGMRVACHLSWCIGVILLLTCSIIVAQLQVLIRYLARLDSDSGDGGYMGSIPERWGYASSSLAIVPCAIGIVAGVFPAFNAMLLSRARAARRDAEEQYRVELEEIRSDGVASHPTKYGQQKVNKALTGPVPVSMGPAPNAASLYPVIDDAPGL